MIMNQDLVPGSVDIYMQKGLFYDMQDMDNPQKIATITSNDWEEQQGMYMYVYQGSFDEDYYSFYISITLDDGSVITISKTERFNVELVRKYLEELKKR